MAEQMRQTYANAEEMLSRFEASLDSDALAPQPLPIGVVRHRGLVPLTLVNRKCRVGEDWVKGGCPMKAIVVTDQAAGTAGMTLVERPEPEPAINDVVVRVHASGFTSGELTWPSTWTDRLDRDRTPSIPGQELAGVVTALGYGTTGLS